MQTESIYSSRTGGLTGGTLDRHLSGTRPISSVPIRSLSTQHIGGPSSLSLRSPSVRRMRQLLELSGGPASPAGSVISGHQSPAPTPSTTLPRPHRQIDINPAEFSKYKLDKPGKLHMRLELRLEDKLTVRKFSSRRWRNIRYALDSPTGWSRFTCDP